MSCQDCNNTVLPEIINTSVVIGPQGPQGPQGQSGPPGIPGPKGNDAVILLYSDTTDTNLLSTSGFEVLSQFAVPGNTLTAVGQFLELEADILGTSTSVPYAVYVGFSFGGNNYVDYYSLQVIPTVGTYGKIQARIFYTGSTTFSYDTQGIKNTSAIPVLKSATGAGFSSGGFTNTQGLGVCVFKPHTSVIGDFKLRNVTVKKYLK